VVGPRRPSWPWMVPSVWPAHRGKEEGRHLLFPAVWGRGPPAAETGEEGPI
jgi:hypothetical protein